MVMSKHAFFISDDRVIHIANPTGAGFQYRAQEVDLIPGTRSMPSGWTWRKPFSWS